LPPTDFMNAATTLEVPAEGPDLSTNPTATGLPWANFACTAAAVDCALEDVEDST
jgi:hypothetical protein